jgi:excinuclease ABC subunit C
MIKASAGQHFEHAARMREDVRILRWLANRLAGLKRARENYSFLYEIQGLDGRDIWYLIRKGGVEAAMARPKNATQWRSLRTQLAKWHCSAGSVGAGYLRHEETIGLVTSWFQKQRDELLKTHVVTSVPKNWSEIASSLFQQQALKEV